MGRIIAKHRGHTTDVGEASKSIRLNERIFELLEKYRKEKGLPTLQDALEELVIEHLAEHKGYRV